MKGPRRLIFLLVLLLMLGVACTEGDYNEDDEDENDGFDDEEEDDDADGSAVPGPGDNDFDDDIIGDDDDDDTAPECSGMVLFVLTPGERNMPFPTDMLTYDDPTSVTGKRIFMTGGNVATFLDPLIELLPFMAEGMNQINGFGMRAALLVPVSTPPSRGLLPWGEDPGAGDTAVLVVTDPDSPHDGEFWPIRGWYDDVLKAIALDPVFTLPEETTFTFAVLDGLRTADGDCYRADDHFNYLKREEIDSTHLDVQLLEPVRLMFEPIFADLAEAGIDRENVLVAAQFTTQNISFVMDSVREQLADKAAKNPPEWYDLEIQPGGETSPVDVYITGKFDAPDWRDRQTDWFNQDENGAPFSTRENAVPFRMTIPKETETYQQPFPVLIYGHGILSSNNEARRLGEYLAPYGIAVIGMDMEYNGQRSVGEVWLDALNLIDVFNPVRMRDNLRQSATELMWLYHVVRNLDDLDLVPGGGGDEIDDLDVNYIVYGGHSWGSLMGAQMVAFMFDIDTFALDAPAGDWITIAQESDNVDYIFEIIAVVESIFGTHILDNIWAAVPMMECVLDAVDPATMGQFYREQRADDPREMINIQHQFIAYDYTLPNSACTEFAMQFGYPQVGDVITEIPYAENVAAPHEGSGVYQYDTDEHNLIMYNDSNPLAAAHHHQMAHYIRSGYETGTPEIIDPFAE